jgi:AcrR family transcriptional regulator
VPRAFTTAESDRIRAQLMAAGRESFARHGLRGTSVDQLARAAAISKGAFYRFFASKEDRICSANILWCTNPSFLSVFDRDRQ